MTAKLTTYPTYAAPSVPEGFTKLSPAHNGNSHLHHQECGRDGEDPIAEELHAGAFEQATSIIGHRAILLVEGIPCHDFLPALSGPLPLPAPLGLRCYGNQEVASHAFRYQAPVP
jgi:hypothetical protein